MKKRKQRGLTNPRHIEALRNQEMAITEQAGHAYEHSFGQWRQKPTPRRTRSASVAGSP